MKTKRITEFAILLALATIFGYLDRIICLAILPPSFFVKIGLANLVLLVFIYNDSFWGALLMGFLKSLFLGLILFSTSGLVTFIIGVSGTMFGVFGMSAIRYLFKNKKSMILASCVGGFMHPIGQLLGAYLVYQSSEVFLSGLVMLPLLLIIGVLTGCLLGVLAIRVDKILQIVSPKKNKSS